MFDRFKRRTQNVGEVDFYFRMIFGTISMVIGYIVFFENGNTNGLYFFLGALPVMTALMKWCPMYYIFGVSSCQLKHK